MITESPFCRGLRRAIRDERAAAELYGRLAPLAPSPSARRILNIRADELRHRPQFIQMYRSYCR